MPKIHRHFQVFLDLLFDLLRWIPLASLAGILAGSASALLLASLNLATSLRETHPWLIDLLGPAGLAVGLLYHHFGRSVEAGSNLILEEIHDPKDTIPLRMTPLILVGTFLTHLFGGSAGREGTAIQTGASLADQLARPFRLSPANRRILLMAGISAGFASVFGTPLAGAIFGLEVLTTGSLGYEALVPCFLAAFAGDLTTRAWGIHHTLYQVTSIPPIRVFGLLTAIAAGIAFGLTAYTFHRLTQAVTTLAKRLIPYPPLRPLLGGILVTATVLAFGTTRYIGLGIPTILESFHSRVPLHDFAAKILFTAVTLGSGFKGGEVTPLFFIGSTLGSSLSGVLPLPASLLAGMGFVAVFAGAANTPFASTMMAAELFGMDVAAYAGLACVVSYLFSGDASIYHAQRLTLSKLAARRPPAGEILTAKSGEAPKVL